MFSKKEIKLVLIFSVLVLFISGVVFAAYSHFSKVEPIATEDYSDFNAVIAESGEDAGYVVEDSTGTAIEGPNAYQVFEKEYALGEEVLEGFVEEITMQMHKIEKGDSIYSLAKKYSINEDIINFNNPDLAKTLKIGQEVKIFNGNYIEYKVKKGDTILAIANKFNIKVTEIIRINSLEATEIMPNQVLILKNPDLDNYNEKINAEKINTGKIAKLPSGGGGTIGRAVKNGFAIRWPTGWSGVTSGFGRRFHPVLGRYIFHMGVDLTAHYVPCYVSADGVVSMAGFMSGYGLIVVVKHSNGFETRYAHLNKISVRPGQRIKSGDYIGQTGSTGRVTGPHLHFEIRQNGKALNPMSFR